MALFEYFCDACQHQFEQITSHRDPDAGRCPKCLKNEKSRKLISKFAVGGRGDLRETTMHGCHDAHVPLGGGHAPDPQHDHSHDHSHDHAHSHDHGDSGHSHD